MIWGRVSPESFHGISGIQCAGMMWCDMAWKRYGCDAGFEEVNQTTMLDHSIKGMRHDSMDIIDGSAHYVFSLIKITSIDHVHHERPERLWKCSSTNQELSIDCKCKIPRRIKVPRMRLCKDSPFNSTMIFTSLEDTCSWTNIYLVVSIFSAHHFSSKEKERGALTEIDSNPQQQRSPQLLSKFPQPSSSTPQQHTSCKHQSPTPHSKPQQQQHCQ